MCAAAPTDSQTFIKIMKRRVCTHLSQKRPFDAVNHLNHIDFATTPMGIQT